MKDIAYWKTYTVAGPQCQLCDCIIGTPVFISVHQIFFIQQTTAEPSNSALTVLHDIQSTVWYEQWPKQKFVFSRNDASFINTAAIFYTLVCILILCVVVSGQGSQAEMNHVCPCGVCTSSSAGAAAAAAPAAVYEPSWTKLIGHMLPQPPVCLVFEKSKACLSELDHHKGLFYKHMIYWSSHKNSIFF